MLQTYYKLLQLVNKFRQSCQFYQVAIAQIYYLLFFFVRYTQIELQIYMDNKKYILIYTYTHMYIYIHIYTHIHSRDAYTLLQTLQ